MNHPVQALSWMVIGCAGCVTVAHWHRAVCIIYCRAEWGFIGTLLISARPSHITSTETVHACSMDIWGLCRAMSSLVWHALGGVIVRNEHLLSCLPFSHVSSAVLFCCFPQSISDRHSSVSVSPCPLCMSLSFSMPQYPPHHTPHRQCSCSHSGSSCVASPHQA